MWWPQAIFISSKCLRDELRDGQTLWLHLFYDVTSSVFFIRTVRETRDVEEENDS